MVNILSKLHRCGLPEKITGVNGKGTGTNQS